MPTQRQEEKRLLLEYHRTGSRRDRDAVVARFMPLACSLARRYRRGGEPLDDLEQVACLALVKAVEGFDPSRETAFSTYAVPTISGALKRHYRDCGWSVRMPRELQELAVRVERLNGDALATSGASPTAAQIAMQAGVSVEEVIEAREAYQALRADSLDQPQHSGEDDGGGPLVESLGHRDPALDRAFERVVLESLLETLEDRERTIVRLYYLEELTQAEIGLRLGYSQMHVSRLLRQAIERLAQAAAQEAERSTLAAA